LPLISTQILITNAQTDHFDRYIVSRVIENFDSLHCTINNILESAFNSQFHAIVVDYIAYTFS